MFRIRRIFDDVFPADRKALEQARQLLRSRFELLDQKKIDRIPESLRSPLKYGFRSIVFVAEDHRSQVHGLALLAHDADLKFCYLDYLVSDKQFAGRGIGGALYERVRSEGLSLGVVGLFFECLPDDPNLCRSPEILKQNRARLKFYEAYGARPIINTAYETPIRAGYYCIDTFTPISRRVYIAARRAVDCALTAANEILSGRSIAYALVRPPGHHAERSFFGGFCYFNNGAIAAQYLSQFGKIAILDIDYHHGNGQQEIFYHRSDVLTILIHGHPSFAYPYFSGFADERGEGEGRGYNINYPLAETIDVPDYFHALYNALSRIRSFNADYLVVCLGLDTAKGDPTGTWNLKSRDFTTIGLEIGRLRKPCLVVQEGGYNNRMLGSNARSFFDGILSGHRL